MTSTLTALHSAALRGVLQRLLALRPCAQAWDYVTGVDPNENFTLLFHAEAHHLAGRTESRVSALPSPLYQSGAAVAACANGGGDATAMIDALEGPSARCITTLWYTVPARSFGHISVGTIISGNEDSTQLLELDASRRLVRYMRDDLRGDFLTYHRTDEHVEVFYNFPKSTTERVRALIRFERLAFDAATATEAGASASGSVSLSTLLAAVTSSHLVQENRQCPICLAYTNACRCRFSGLATAQGAHDLRNNALNMHEQVGEYYGLSYHYVRHPFYLQEHFNKNVVYPTNRSFAAPLREWAAHHCLARMPLAIPINHLPLEMLTPPAETRPLDLGVAITPLVLPSAMSGSELPAPASAVAPAAVAGVGNLRAPTSLSDISLEATSVKRPGATAGRGDTSRPAPAPVIAKQPKRRGRRPREPIIRPAQPVPIAPVPGGVSRAPAAEFSSPEEYKQHLKKLRSRMSAARSNEKRAKRNAEEKEKAERKGAANNKGNT